MRLNEISGKVGGLKVGTIFSFIGLGIGAYFLYSLYEKKQTDLSIQSAADANNARIAAQTAAAAAAEARGEYVPLQGYY